MYHIHYKTYVSADNHGGKTYMLAGHQGSERELFADHERSRSMSLFTGPPARHCMMGRPSHTL